MSAFPSPPEGLDLTESRAAINNAVVGLVMGIATFFFALRIWARVSPTVRIGADDWCSGVSLVFAYGTGICCILGGGYGIGKHIWALGPDDIDMSMKIIFAYIILYANTVPMVKLSVLLLYHRIFPLKWTLYFCAFLSIGYGIAVSVTIACACKPTSYFWTQWADPLGGECVIDLTAFYFWNALANLLTDVLILCLPMPLIWKLQMPGRQKLAVCGIFLLGGFVCVASAVRIYTITKMSDTMDMTWAIGDAMIWSNVEPCIGIVSACLPTLRPLLRKLNVPWIRPHGGDPSYNKNSRLGGSSTANRKPEYFGSGRRGHDGHKALSGSSTGDQSVQLSPLNKATFRPDDDEVLLTTNVQRGDRDAHSTGTSTTGTGKGSLGNITVNQSFQWSVSNAGPRQD